MSISSEISAHKIKGFLENEENYLIKVYDSLDSTNTEAKRFSAQYSDNMVIIAKEQSGGRGRLGRTFFSKGGLYISFLIKCDFKMKNILSVTTAASVAVCRAIRSANGKEADIKWVNDIYINNRKVCGILTEGIWDNKNESLKYIIIGIGINCGKCSFPEEISDIAGSIGEADLNLLAAELICEVDKIPEMIEDKSYIEEYRKKSMVIGKDIKILQKNKFAKVLDVDENGGLIILTDEGEETLSTGEISIRLCENN